MLILIVVISAPSFLDIGTATANLIHHQPRPRITLEVTAYTAGPESTGKSPGDPAYGITASGYHLSDSDAWQVAAADPKYYPIGTRIYLDGVGVVRVEDTGGAIQGPNKLDLFVGMAAVDTAYKWGRQHVKATIIGRRL